MNKCNITIGLVLLALSFGAGYYATPSKVKTEVKEVVKTVKEEAKTKIVYREKIVYKDGTVVERETEREDTNTKESSESSRTSKNETTKDTGLTLSALAIADIKDVTGQREYGIHVTKRVFSNVVVGAMVTTDKKIGISAGVSF